MGGYDESGGSIGRKYNSANLATAPDLYAEMRYKAWGETRATSGSMPTSFTYTGQRAEVLLGISYFKARWYDTSLGRFLQPDSIVPLASQGVMAHDRYAGMNNNPVRFNDPTGHDVGCGGRDGSGCFAPKQTYWKTQKSSIIVPTRTPSNTFPYSPTQTPYPPGYAAWTTAKPTSTSESKPSKLEGVKPTPASKLGAILPTQEYNNNPPNQTVMPQVAFIKYDPKQDVEMSWNIVVAGYENASWLPSQHVSPYFPANYNPLAASPVLDMIVTALSTTTDIGMRAFEPYWNMVYEETNGFDMSNPEFSTFIFLSSQNLNNLFP